MLNIFLKINFIKIVLCHFHMFLYQFHRCFTMLFPRSITVAIYIFHKLFTNRSFVLYLYIIYRYIVRYFFYLPGHKPLRMITNSNISNHIKLIFTNEKHLTIDCILYIVQYLLSIIVNNFIIIVLFENIW